MLPEGQVLVSDMSSSLCSKKIDWSKHGVVYAGAHKNVGPAGVTILIARKDLIGKHKKNCPVLCQWEASSKAEGTYYNTPVCWSVYMCGLNIAHMLKQGGLPAMAEQAKAKSDFLYDYIDSSDFYSNDIELRYRSRINIVFRIRSDSELEAKFITDATEHGLIDLKTRRGYPGCRASIYNAMPMDGVIALKDFMIQFKA